MSLSIFGIYPGLQHKIINIRNTEVKLKFRSPLLEANCMNNTIESIFTLILNLTTTFRHCHNMIDIVDSDVKYQLKQINCLAAAEVFDTCIW